VICTRKHWLKIKKSYELSVVLVVHFKHLVVGRLGSFVSASAGGSQSVRYCDGSHRSFKIYSLRINVIWTQSRELELYYVSKLYY
jgi:hypothetical protein